MIHAPATDLSSIFGPISESVNFENVDVLDNFPKQDTEALDPSQLQALEMMLTRRLAIVQGPPGTGKTHVSVVALKCLLSRVTAADPPLIIASHTNHALDQLLRYVAEFEPNFIRVGGRTTDQGVVKERTLFEMKRKMRQTHVSTGGAYHRLKIQEEALCTLLKPFHDKKGPYTIETFRKHGLLTQKQCESLQSGSKTWVSTRQGDEAADPMTKWLGEELIEVENKYDTAEELGFEFEEVDQEFEQLKEFEAETNGANEDEKVDALSGKFLSITETHVVLQYPGRAKQVDKALQKQDLWTIDDYTVRSAIYHYLQSELKIKIRRLFREAAKEYFREAQNVRSARYERDAAVLQTAKVIGLTTTGLVKNRAVLHCLKPRILMIEEAAEALEGTIAAGCVESIEHLILVGDHKQRRGSCAVHDLTGPPFNLGISLFERLLMNKLPHTTLVRQRRMAPEIRRILAPIYDQLEDHSTVLNRPDVPGMGTVASFFFTHRWPESTDSFSSRINSMEAMMVVGMFNHLVYNGVDAKAITVLTFYNGQRKEILKSLKRHPNLQGRFFNVKTVDSYQGR